MADDKLTPHPAKFSKELYPIIREMLEPVKGRVLDPFAGVGRIHDLHSRTVGIELEPEWANQHGKTLIGNALELPFKDGFFEALCTSPCYGNRLADTYVDHTRRIHYTAYLGRTLTEGSAASMQWGKRYRDFHTLAWEEATRVTTDVFVLNCKNHIRNGELQMVTEWHIMTLQSFGWKLQRMVPVEVPGHREGENHAARVEFETVALLVR